MSGQRSTSVARGQSARSSRTREGRANKAPTVTSKWLSVPERFMRPRIVLLVTTAVLLAFGLLMVYSASSITAMFEQGDPALYLKKQAGFAIVGIVLAAAVAKCDYRLIRGKIAVALWAIIILTLAVVFIPSAGRDAYGATRWINIAGFQFQPSEFAKVGVVVVAAALANDYFSGSSNDLQNFWTRAGVAVGLPVLLIAAQPDKGTMMVLVASVIVMIYLAGLPKKIVVGMLALCVVGFLALSLKDDYSRQRILTMFNPWADRFNTGYQLIQGFFAFASGGLFGVGIGFSRQKYSYLPMAHNDFIFAVIGEECGLVGTLGVLLGFALIAWAGLQIARHAPDLTGRLIAAGCTSLLIIQMLLNIAGVLGVFPLSGKPVPLISYGGSSMMGSLLTVGAIFSVSLHSRLPETSHDTARRGWSVASGSGVPLGYASVAPEFDEAEGIDGSTAGAATPRGSRSRTTRGLTVVEGGSSGSATQERRSSRQGRSSTGRTSYNQDKRGSRASRTASSSGARTTRERIDLGPSAADRLRGGQNRRGRKR